MFIDDILDLTKHELRNSVIQNLATPPSSPLEGQVYYDTALHQFGCYQNGAWVYLGTLGTNGVTKASNASAGSVLQVSGGADKTIQDFISAGGIIKVSATGVVSLAVAGTDYLTGSSTNALTNKTFDANGTGNAISNLETADFATNVIDTDVNLTANSDTRLATQKAVKAYADGLIASVAKPKGGIDCSANPNYPAAAVGDFYRVTVAGKIGGASGPDVEVGDELHCFVAGVAGNHATVGANWTIVQTNVAQATTTTIGLLAIATVAETDAKSVSNKAVVPSDLVNHARISEQQFGNGSLTSFTIAHGRGSSRVDASVYDVSTGEKRYPKIVIDGTNIVISGYITAPTTNQFKVVWVG